MIDRLAHPPVAKGLAPLDVGAGRRAARLVEKQPVDPEVGVRGELETRGGADALEGFVRHVAQKIDLAIEQGSNPASRSGITVHSMRSMLPR